MNIKKIKSIIESILFAVARDITKEEFIEKLNISSEEFDESIFQLQEDYKKEDRGIEIIQVKEGYQLATKKENYEYVNNIIKNKNKVVISKASLEVLAIIAYNNKIVKSEIDAIRGVDSSASIYKLIELDLIEQVGKSDLPGKPLEYAVTKNFFKVFGVNEIEELPKLPKIKMDENNQIIIEESE